jgi:hypothetical protein
MVVRVALGARACLQTDDDFLAGLDIDLDRPLALGTGRWLCVRGSSRCKGLDWLGGLGGDRRDRGHRGLYRVVCVPRTDQ